MIKQMLRMRENEISRVKISFHHVFLVLTLRPQILFSESCTSPNILVAPTSKMIILTMLAKKLLPVR